MTSPLPAIAATNLTLSLGQGDSAVQVLRGIDLSVPLGQTLALLGPSGSGKSSLMAVLSGLERASSGSLSIGFPGLLYDPARYANLAITLPLSTTDWSQTVSEFAPLDSLVSSLALVDIADATATFEVEFDWLGTGMPGSQPFEIFADGFDIVTTARTTPFGTTPPDPTVPEPGTLVLTAAALLALSSQGLRRRATAPTPITHA